MRDIDLEDDQWCIMCGEKNPHGMKLKFNLNKEKLSASAKFISSKYLQGFNNVVHGGVIAALLDEIIAQASIAGGLKTLTAEIIVRYKKIVPINTEIVVEGKITSRNRRLIQGEGALLLPDGSIAATAQAKLVPIDL
jgi:acyl-coenzyme A thioesterase PaaI-like protein